MFSVLKYLRLRGWCEALSSVVLTRRPLRGVFRVGLQIWIFKNSNKKFEEVLILTAQQENNTIFMLESVPRPKTNSLGRRSWALPKTCNFRSWALSWAQTANSDEFMLKTFLLGPVPKTNDIPLERFNHLNYFETWAMPVRPCCLTAGIVVGRLPCEAIK